jgi:hypothetical protein
MTQNKEIIKVNPTVVDSIEYYVSDDTKESGMSISGLARLIGVAESTIRKLDVEILRDRFSDESYSLEVLQNGIFALGVESSNGAKVIKSEACSLIIRYFAFENTRVSKEIQQQAKFVYHKISTKGIHKWICETVGIIEDKNEARLIAQFQEMLLPLIEEIKESKQVAKEFKAIRQHTDSYMPGVSQLMDNITETPLLKETNDGYISLEGWLFQKGISLNDSKFRSLARQVADTYKSLCKCDPEKRHFKEDGKRTKYNVSVYKPEHYAILQICLEKVLGI